MSSERSAKPQTVGDVLAAFAAALDDQRKRGLPRLPVEQVRRIQEVVRVSAEAGPSRAGRLEGARKKVSPADIAEEKSAAQPTVSGDEKRQTSTRSASPSSASRPSADVAVSSSAPRPIAEVAEHVTPASSTSDSRGGAPLDRTYEADAERMPWMMSPEEDAAEKRREEMRAREAKSAASKVSPPREDAGTNDGRAAVPMVARGEAAAPDASAYLEQLRRSMLQCTRCRLSETRTQVVFGDGSAQARVVFVGEAPSTSDDVEGRIFGKDEGGALLTAMIQAMGLSREEVFVTSSLKCRTPNHRPGERDELVACAPTLRQQIETIEPEVIVALGSEPSRLLLGRAFEFTAQRGQWGQWEEVAVMPTWDPRYLVQHPEDKASAWADLQQVMARLGLRRP